MTLLFLDLETSGLILKALPLGDDQQPWAVRIAAEHTDETGRRFNAVDLTIKPAGRKMKREAIDKHGIENIDAERYGMAENAILSILADMAGKTRRVVTFGDFDPQVVTSLMLRLARSLGKPEDTFSRKWNRPGLEFLNLQHPACQLVCKIDVGREDGEFKRPSLDEAGATILGEKPREGFHDAWDDLGRTKRLYFELMRLGHFEEITS